jgi:hypothetical protein
MWVSRQDIAGRVEYRQVKNREEARTLAVDWMRDPQTMAVRLTQQLKLAEPGLTFIPRGAFSD